MSDPVSIWLVGFMGAGKSEVGRRLASRSGRAFVDTDAEIERRANRTIAQIFDEEGEPAFRRREAELVVELVAVSGRVVATGGGLFQRREHRRLIKSSGLSVWLDLPLSQCRRRIGEGSGRPLWEGLHDLELQALFDRRRAAYALADLRVDASQDPDLVVETILARGAISR